MRKVITLLTLIFFQKAKVNQAKPEKGNNRMTYLQRRDQGFNNHYNGYAFELKNWNKERQQSILAINSAGSLSPIDIVAIRKDYVLLVTCKANGYLTPKERKDLDKLKAKLPAFCKLQLRYKIGHKLHKQWL